MALCECNRYSYLLDALFMIDIVSKKILDYCENHSSGEPKIYKKIKELTYNKEALPQMLSGKMVGNVLQLLLKLMNAKNVLELGTFTGYSALKMAEVLQGKYLWKCRFQPRC